MIEIVPATREIIERQYGGLTAKTVTAVAVIDGERVLGIAGVYLDDARQIVFGEITDELRAKPKSLIRGWRKLREIIERRKMPTHVLADKNVEASGRFLSHVGFEHVDNGVYAWPGS